jgi:hypothetical protein
MSSRAIFIHWRADEALFRESRVLTISPPGDIRFISESRLFSMGARNQKKNRFTERSGERTSGSARRGNNVIPSLADAPVDMQDRVWAHVHGMTFLSPTWRAR